MEYILICCKIHALYIQLLYSKWSFPKCIKSYKNLCLGKKGHQISFYHLRCIVVKAYLTIFQPLKKNQFLKPFFLRPFVSNLWLMDILSSEKYRARFSWYVRDIFLKITHCSEIYFVQNVILIFKNTFEIQVLLLYCI